MVERYSVRLIKSAGGPASIPDLRPSDRGDIVVELLPSKLP